MPTVARFEGIKIQFFAKEHPPPHFHAVFAEHRAQIAIQGLAVLRGSLPPAKLRAVMEWAQTREIQLIAAWEQVNTNQAPGKIE